eukprot:gene468-1361_t
MTFPARRGLGIDLQEVYKDLGEDVNSGAALWLRERGRIILGVWGARDWLVWDSAQQKCVWQVNQAPSTTLRRVCISA